MRWAVIRTGTHSYLSLLVTCTAGVLKSSWTLTHLIITLAAYQWTRKKSNVVTHRVVITGTVDPYKYEITSSYRRIGSGITFSFEDGIIRDYRNIEINGDYTLIIPGRRKRVIPVFTCTAPLTVTYNGQSYDLPAGESKSPILHLAKAIMN